MSTHTVTVQCPAVLDSTDGPCEADLEIECEIEPGEMYGADADGNRGVWQAAALLPGEVPVECPECHTKFDAFQTAEIEKQLNDLCQEWDGTEGTAEDEPEYDYKSDTSRW